MAPQKKITARSRKQRVFLVEDHPITREGFAQLLNFQPDLEVCGQAEAPAQALTGIAATNPDLAIVDIGLANGSGLELIKELNSRHAKLPTLVLSTHDELIYAERALRAGAKGYVMKQEPTEHVMTAVRQVLRGEVYISAQMRQRLVDKAVQGQTLIASADLAELTDRELEVFRLLGRGRTTRQIALELHVSVSTVETYRAHLKEKLRLKNATDLVRHAVAWSHTQGS